jgi:hypothetical protein
MVNSTAAVKPKVSKAKGISSTRKGIYTPVNPQKYLGDPRKIRYLSSWEVRFMQFCDMNPHIISWGSEEFRVKYWHPIKGKVCEYIPDFIIKYKTTDGTIKTEVIEIKPKKQSVISSNMSTYDKVSLVINHAKWTAAKAICDSHGIVFRVVTDDDLFPKRKK